MTQQSAITIFFMFRLIREWFSESAGGGFSLMIELRIIHV